MLLCRDAHHGIKDVWDTSNLGSNYMFGTADERPMWRLISNAIWQHLLFHHKQSQWLRVWSDRHDDKGGYFPTTQHVHNSAGAQWRKGLTWKLACIVSCTYCCIRNVCVDLKRMIIVNLTVYQRLKFDQILFRSQTATNKQNIWKIEQLVSNGLLLCIYSVSNGDLVAEIWPC